MGDKKSFFFFFGGGGGGGGGNFTLLGNMGNTIDLSFLFLGKRKTNPFITREKREQITPKDVSAAVQNDINQVGEMRFPKMWYVRPACPQIRPRIRAV